MAPTRIIRLAGTALALVVLASSSLAATIQIVNKDGVGEGFNQGTAVAPIGGNPGTTVGQQRLNVFNQAAAIWGSILPSSVVIKVDATFDPLTCSATSGTLGSTYANGAYGNFSGAEWTNTWYVVALAEKQHGSNLNSTASEMVAQFNSSVDNSTCLGTISWYYGYDHNHGSNVDLLATVLHELGHGLGFTSLVDPSNGQYGGYPSQPLPDAYTRFLYDNTQGKYWTQMTAAQRAASAINNGNLTWRGAVTASLAGNYLGPMQVVSFSGTGGFTGDKQFGTADFGPPLGYPPIVANVVYVNDGTFPAGDGCTSPFTNAGSVAGKIALIDRGNCDFVVKTKNAQDNGAVAVIIANNTTGIVYMAGDDPSITIPTVSISQSDGTALKTALGSGTVVATLGTDPSQRQGGDAAGYPLMYAPNPLEAGSSVSHFDVSAYPDLLMEPAITPDLTSSVDLTRYVFEDMGWFLPRTSSVGPRPSVAMSLETGAPNPFRVRTSIRYSLSQPGFTDMGVYDIAGRLVKRLMNSWTPAGAGSIVWDGTDDNGARVPSGVYLYRIRQHGETKTQRVVVTD